MLRITIDNHDRICFYGNPAGYLQNNKAVVDPMFQNPELKSWLAIKNGFEVDWQPGVYEKLSSGWKPGKEALKNVRIWQLCPDTKIGMRFIGYDELVNRFGEPTPDHYQAVFDGLLDTNDLESIYELFNVALPDGFCGHSLSMSDVVELYDNNGSEFHYVDHYDFRQIDFEEPSESQQNEGMEMSMT